MIGAFAEHSGTFLQVVAALTLVAFAIPITLAPFSWAAALRWTVEPRTDHLALTLVHVVGVVQKVQPWTETAEIAFWAGLALLALLFYPA